MHLVESLSRCRAARWFGALFYVRVASDIVADVEKQQAKIAQAAYSAEQADLEAAKLIEVAARDGFSQADQPALSRALKLIRRSANADRQITEAAAI